MEQERVLQELARERRAIQALVTDDHVAEDVVTHGPGGEGGPNDAEYQDWAQKAGAGKSFGGRKLGCPVSSFKESAAEIGELSA